jgi:MFS family permease
LDKFDKLRSNVKKNYVFTLLKGLDFTRGIWMLYLASKGLSLTQLGLLETIFHVASFLMEVPTGVIADVFGRKVSRILGRMASLLSIILLFTVNNFMLLAISFISSAISYDLESGAGDSLIYDSMIETKDEEKYMKVSGTRQFFIKLANVVSFLVGGYIATKGYSLAFVITIVISFIVIIQSFTFTEPTIIKIDTKNSNNVFKDVFQNSITVIKDKPIIIFYIVFIEVLMAICACIFNFMQSYLFQYNFNEALIGIVLALSSFFVAVFSPLTAYLEKALKQKGMLLIIPIISSFCLWGVALTKIHFVFFIMLNISEGFLYVAVYDYINKLIPSNTRATILSYSSMAFSFFMIIFFPLTGYIGDNYSLKFAFIILSVILTILVFVNFFVQTKIIFNGKRKES